MKSTTRDLASRLPWAGLVIFGLAVFVFAGIFDRLELATGDAAFNLRGPRTPKSQILIVAIDQVSFAANNLRWPWPRDYLAQIVQVVATGRPAVLAIDILFPEPSRQAAEDSAFANALLDMDHVVLATVRETEEFPPGIYSSQLLQPIDLFATNVQSVGAVNVTPDSDGIVRIIPQAVVFNDNAYPTFASQVAAIYRGDQPQTVLRLSSNTRSSEQLINYRGPAHTFQLVPAALVANGNVPSDTFSDKVVLIGVTDPSLKDMFHVPFGGYQSPMPGVEVIANEVDTLIAGDAIHRYGITGNNPGLAHTPADSEFVLMAFVAIAAILGFRLEQMQPFGNLLGRFVAFFLAYLAGWAIVLFAFNIQLPLVSTELAFAAGLFSALIKSRRLRLSENAS